MWAEEVKRFSWRDQMSFDFCCWKLGIKYSELPISKPMLVQGDMGLHLEKHSKPRHTVKGTREQDPDYRDIWTSETEQWLKEWTSPLVSLIIPSWNTPLELYKKCLASIANLRGATQQNFECIIVDDGATDETPKLADELAKKCSYVKVIHQKNAGNTVARNVGLKQMRGKYTAFLDCDDEVLPTMLLNAAESVRENPSTEVFNYNDIGNPDRAEAEEMRVDVNWRNTL